MNKLINYAFSEKCDDSDEEESIAENFFNTDELVNKVEKICIYDFKIYLFYSILEVLS